MATILRGKVWMHLGMVMIVTMDHEQEQVLGNKYPIIHIKIWKLLLIKKRCQ